MATISPSNSDNFLTWQKVNGSLTLANLQANGLPLPPDTRRTAEAQAVIERMTDLTALQESIIGIFIDAEVRNTNYAEYDEAFLFSLGATNGLTGFKSKTATNHGATFNINGATFAGAEWIDLNWNPSVDGSNFGVNNNQVEAYIQDWGALLNTAFPFGSHNSTYNTSLWAAITVIRGHANSGTHAQYGSAFPSGLFATIRSDASNIDILQDGVSKTPTAQAAIALVSADIFAGARNSAGTAGLFSDCVMPFIMMGGELPDQAAHNTNVVNLLTGLGLTL